MEGHRIRGQCAQQLSGVGAADLTPVAAPQMSATTLGAFQRSPTLSEANLHDQRFLFLFSHFLRLCEYEPTRIARTAMFAGVTL
jgi:hypothetical protein